MTPSKMNKRDKLAYLADLEEGYRPFDKHALSLLRSLLDDGDAEVRAEAIACLWDDPDPRWIDLLMQKATHDAHAEVRAHAISALGRYVFEGEAAEFEGWASQLFNLSPQDYARVVEFLFNIARDADEATGVRRYAIEALAFRSDDPAVGDLIEWAYSQHDRRLKVSSLFAMARHGGPRWTPYILTELESTDSQIQYEAVRAAGELGLREATETLIDLAQNRSTKKPLRLLAIYALAETGDERAYPVLEKLVRSRDRDIRDVAREAIEEWRTVNEIEQMADDDTDFDPEDIADYFDVDDMPEIWGAENAPFSRN